MRVEDSTADRVTNFGLCGSVVMISSTWCCLMMGCGSRSCVDWKS